MLKLIFIVYGVFNVNSYILSFRLQTLQDFEKMIGLLLSKFDILDNMVNFEWLNNIYVVL